MSWYSDFELTVKKEGRNCNGDELQEIISTLKNINEEKYFEVICCLSLDMDNYFQWTDDEEIMKEVSILYPHSLFALYDSDNENIRYFYGGKMQVAEIVTTYENFDPDKLA